MPRFLRAFVPGGTFFFTLVTYRRHPLFVTPLARLCLRRSIREVQARRPFALEGFVLLPDHLHCVMTLPPGDMDFSTRWRKIKEGFTRSFLAIDPVGRVIDPTFREPAVTVGQHRKGLRGLWQQRFWEHTIRDETDFGRHMNYIHFNPVKHGHATCPHGWPWSTFKKWVRIGVYKPDWYCACGKRNIRGPDFDDLAATAME